MIFDYDWWYGGGFERQLQLAKRACTANKFPDAGEFDGADESPAARFCRELETRTVLYLRDGFSYEIKRLVDAGTTAVLGFECVPTDEPYKVGAFIVCVSFEEVARVETFAVHPSERPDEQPSIKGFGGGVAPPGRGDDRGSRSESRE